MSMLLCAYLDDEGWVGLCACGGLVRSDEHREREVVEPWNEPLPLRLPDRALHQGDGPRKKEAEDDACDDE